MRVNGFYSIFCPHSQGLSPQKKRWLGKTGATFTACSPWKTIQFRHWYTSHIIKAVSDRGSPAGKTQAVQCPHKVRTSPAYSSGVQPPFPKPAPRENVLFELGSNRVNMRGMCKADELWYKGARNEPDSLHSMNSSGFHSTKPSPGANYSTTNSQNSICCESGGNSRIWTIGNVINKNRTILYLIRPAEAAMEREQLRSRWNVEPCMHRFLKTHETLLPRSMHSWHPQIFQSFSIGRLYCEQMLPSQCAPFRHSSSLAMVEGWIFRLTTFPNDRIFAGLFYNRFQK